MTNSRTAEPPPAWAGGPTAASVTRFAAVFPLLNDLPALPTSPERRDVPPNTSASPVRLVRTDAQLVRPWLDTKYAASLGIRASTRAQYSGCAGAQNINSPRSQNFLTFVIDRTFPIAWETCN